MQNYFRITAYHPTENISVIMDSYGKFEKLWQFSAYMVSKGFKIIAVGGEDKFEFGDMSKVEYNTNQIYLRAYKIGTTEILTYTEHSKHYNKIIIKAQYYLTLK